MKAFGTDRLLFILDHAPVMILGFSPDGRLIYWNDKLAETTGWTAEEVITEPSLMARLWSDCSPPAGTAVQKADGVFRFGRALTKKGEVREQEWASFALPDGSIVSFGIDVTECGVKEHELMEMQRQQAQFIQNTSHEIRTPLALISGYTELLQASDDNSLGSLNEVQLQAVHVIRRQVDMLCHLVDDILAIFELRDVFELNERVSLTEIVQEVVGDFALQAKQGGLALTHCIDCRSAIVIGKTQHIRQALYNVVRNAVKFTDSGGSISVSLQQEDDLLAIRVADTGIGIAADQQSRIFGRFYQVNGTASRRYGGSGLGLAVVKEIVEAHGGSISVASVLGEGSTFTLYFPVADAAKLGPDISHDGARSPRAT